jgi:hypothetical protein
MIPKDEGLVVPTPRLVPSKVIAEPVVNALDDEAYITPPDVNDVRFVPPLDVPKVPASVTAPVVEVLGVKPLKDVWNEVTGAVTAFDASSFTTPAAFLK